MTKHVINEPKEFSTNLDEIPFGAPALPETFNPSLKQLLNNDAYLKDRIDNINTNDIEARLAIEELKLQMKKKDLLDFAKENVEIGYMDNFTDVTSIDMNKTNAAIDTTTGTVSLNKGDEYSIRVVEDVVNSNIIKSHDLVQVGDRINGDIEILSVTEVSSPSSNVFNNLPVSDFNRVDNSLGGRHSTMLEDGRLVVAGYNRTGSVDPGSIRLSVLNGDSFEVLGSLDVASHNHNYSITSKGNMIYVLTSNSTGNVRVYTVDSENGTIVGDQGLHSNAYSIPKGMCLEVKGNKIYACYSTKAAPQAAESLKYVEGVIGSDSLLTWNQPETINLDPTVNQYLPTLTFTSDGGVLVVYVAYYSNGQQLLISARRSLSGSWTTNTIFSNSDNFPILSPILLDVNSINRYQCYYLSMTPNSGRSYALERVISSNGITWIREVLVPSVEAVDMRELSACCDTEGNVYAYYTKRVDPSLVTELIRMDNKSGEFKSEIIATNSTRVPTVICDSFKEFTEPLIAYHNQSQDRVLFSGSWGSSSRLTYEITLSRTITTSMGSILNVETPIHDLLQFKPQTFPEFRNILMNVKTDALDVFKTRTFTNNRLGIDFTSKEFAIGDVIGEGRNVFKVDSIEGSFDIDKVENSPISVGSSYKLLDEGSGTTFIELWNGDYIAVISDVTSESSWVRLVKSTDKGRTWRYLGRWGYPTISNLQMKASITQVSDTNIALVGTSSLNNLVSFMTVNINTGGFSPINNLYTGTQRMTSLDCVFNPSDGHVYVGISEPNVVSGEGSKVTTYKVKLDPMEVVDSQLLILATSEVINPKVRCVYNGILGGVISFNVIQRVDGTSRIVRRPYGGALTNVNLSGEVSPYNWDLSSDHIGGYILGSFIVGGKLQARGWSSGGTYIVSGLTGIEVDNVSITTLDNGRYIINYSKNGIIYQTERISLSAPWSTPKIVGRSNQFTSIVPESDNIFDTPMMYYNGEVLFQGSTYVNNNYTLVLDKSITSITSLPFHNNLLVYQNNELFEVKELNKDSVLYEYKSGDNITNTNIKLTSDYRVLDSIIYSIS